MRSWKSAALIEASLEELPVRADLSQSCLATKISAPGPSLLGGSATKITSKTFLGFRGEERLGTIRSYSFRSMRDEWIVS